MRFRVQSARGRLELHSAVGVGTTIGAWLPRG
jgi:signal transduction histidine kinase